jgi:hypothetical protein
VIDIRSIARTAQRGVEMGRIAAARLKNLILNPALRRFGKLKLYVDTILALPQIPI